MKPSAVSQRMRSLAVSLGVALALGTICLSDGAAVAPVASKAWDREVKTQDSIDKTAAVAVGDDDEGKFIYLAGSLQAFRGSNTSLEALAEETIETSYDASEKFSDAFVAKLSRVSGSIVWVHRYQATALHGRHKTKYFGVMYDTDKGLVYAVGQKMNPKTRTYNALLTIIDGKNGEVLSTHSYFTESGVPSRLQNIILEKGDLYACGSDASEGSIRNAQGGSDQAAGGIVVMKMNTEGKMEWARKTGLDRIQDRCSAIASSSDGSHLFVAGTIFKLPGDDEEPARPKPSGHTVVQKFKISSGDMVWERMLKQSVSDETNSGALIVSNEAVFVAISRWTDVYRGWRTMLAKVSAASGAELFVKETCCGQILPSLESGSFRGKGSAMAASGLYMGEDNYLYQLVSLRSKKSSPDKNYAAKLVRISRYGDQDETDFSSDLEQYQFDSMRPIGFAAAPKGGKLFAIQRSGDLRGSDEEAWQTKVMEVKSFPTRVAPQNDMLPENGEYYSKVGVKLLSVPKSMATRQKLIEATAELLRIDPSQVDLSIDPHDESMVLRATVFSSNPVATSQGGSTSNNDVRLALDRLKKASAPTSTGFSPLEKIAGTKAGALRRQQSPTVLEQGRFEHMAQADTEQSAAGGRSSGSAASGDSEKRTSASGGSGGDQSEDAKKSKKKLIIIGAGVGGAVGGIALIAIIVAIARR